MLALYPEEIKPHSLHRASNGRPVMTQSTLTLWSTGVGALLVLWWEIPNLRLHSPMTRSHPLCPVHKYLSLKESFCDSASQSQNPHLPTPKVSHTCLPGSVHLSHCWMFASQALLRLTSEADEQHQLVTVLQIGTAKRQDTSHLQPHRLRIFYGDPVLWAEPGNGSGAFCCRQNFSRCFSLQPVS